MKLIKSPEELMRSIADMDRDNSVFQFSIPGKGKFTLVLQEEDQDSIQEDVKNNPHLKQMMEESQKEYRAGKGMSTDDMLKSLSKEDFK